MLSTTEVVQGLRSLVSLEITGWAKYQKQTGQTGHGHAPFQCYALSVLTETTHLCYCLCW